MPRQITIKPSDHRFACDEGDTVLAAATAADLMLPYGCRNGACGTCKGRILEGEVDYGAHQASTLTDDEKAQGPRALLRRAPEDRPRHRGAGGPPRRRHPGPAPALPDRVHRARRRRRRDRPPQAARERAPPVPGRPVHRPAAEGRAAAQLLAGDAAARRRAARAARPAHPRRLLHHPALHRVQGARDPALRGPARVVLPARGLGQAGDPGRRRHRLRADQGDRRARAAPRPGRAAAVRPLLGRPDEEGPLPAGPAGKLAAGPQLHVHPRAVGTRRRTMRGRDARASSTRRCSTTSPACVATRSTPAARRRWSTPRARASRPSGRCRPTSSSPTASPTAPRPRSRPDARPGAATPRRGSGLPNLPGPSRQRFSRRRP